MKFLILLLCIATSQVFAQNVRNIGPLLQNFQDQADTLSTEIETTIAQRRHDLLEALEDGASTAREKYTAHIPIVHNKFLTTTADLFVRGITCFELFADQLDIAYEDAGKAFGSCSRTFNVALNAKNDEAFADDQYRELSIALKSFILKETKGQNIFTSPDLTQEHMQRQLDAYADSWRTSEPDFNNYVDALQMELKDLNVDFNDCLHYEWENFSNDAAKVIADADDHTQCLTPFW